MIVLVQSESILASRSVATSVNAMATQRNVEAGVTANLFRSANLFRRNLFASGFVPDFQKISEFVSDG